MEKPAFDPSKPFEAEKPAFDSSAPLDQDAPIDAPDTSLLGAIKRSAQNKIDLLRSAVHGATGGFDDEAIGALKAGGQSALEATGLKDDGGKSLHDLYRQYQQEAQNDYKTNVSDKNPIASTIGETFGASVPIALSGGVAGGPMAETSAIQKIISGLKTGGALGAISGAGNSENNLDTEQGAEDLIKDTGKSAAFGAGIGGGFSALGQGLKAGIQSAATSGNPFYRQTAKAFQEGAKGLGFGGDANRDRILQGTQDVATDVTKDLSEGFKNISKQYGDTLSSYKQPVQLFSEELQPVSDVKAAIADGSIKLPKSRSDDLVSSLDRLMNGKLSADEAKALQVKLRSLGSGVEGPMRAPFYEAATSIDQSLSDQVPGYSDINSTYKNARTIPESVISKAPGEVNQTYLSDQSKPDEATYKGFKQVIQGSQTGGSSARPSKEAMLNLQSTLDNLQQNDPNTLKTLGIDPDTVMSKIKNQGDLDAIMQSVQGHNAHGGIVSQLLGGHSLKGEAYRTSNFLGQIAAKGGYSPVVNNGHSLVTADPEALHGVSQQLSQNPSTKHLGTALSTALDNGSQTMKNAALFSIMQNPQARKQIFSNSDEDSNNTGDNK